MDIQTALTLKTDAELVELYRSSEADGFTSEVDAITIEIGRRNGYSTRFAIAPVIDIRDLSIDPLGAHYVAGHRRGIRDARSDENGEF